MVFTGVTAAPSPAVRHSQGIEPLHRSTVFSSDSGQGTGTRDGNRRAIRRINIKFSAVCRRQLVSLSATIRA
jgi:hypothetical protein